MSRCFPFPPPGYVLNGIRDEALIVSIKGAEEKAKKEQKRKEEKRNKKDKKDRKDKKDKKDKKDRKEKKEKKEKKRKEREGKEGESEIHSHKRLRNDEGAKVDLFRKLKESEIDCLEKSSLTVERELLQSTSQNSCDSTLNSNEILPKQKEKQPLNGRHNNNDSESIIRIRLPIRRQKDSEVMMTTKEDQEKACSSGGIKLNASQLATREPVNQHPCSTSAPEHTSKPRQEKRKDPILRGKHGKEKISSSSTPETYLPSSLCSICPPSMALQFLNVVENWVPNTIERRVDFTNSEDEECWWSTKKSSSPTERCKQLNRNNEINHVSKSMGWPCARILPEADVYALPYTVPF